jgi:hypothetical protein
MNRLASIMLLVSLAVAGRAFSGDEKQGCDGCDKKPAPCAAPGFAKLAKLAGTWETKPVEGKAARVTFQVVSAGSALLETHAMHGDGSDMVTLYHGDGDHLALTHYCSVGNQPRMKAKKVTDEAIEFEFVDATNLAKPTDGHMHSLTVKFKDADHYAEEWTFKQGDAEKHVTLEFERKK